MVFILSSLPFLVLVPHRFLRARKFNLNKTKEMLLSAEKWRTDFKVDEIIKFVFSMSPAPMFDRYITQTL